MRSRSTPSHDLLDARSLARETEARERQPGRTIHRCEQSIAARAKFTRHGPQTTRGSSHVDQISTPGSFARLATFMRHGKTDEVIKLCADPGGIDPSCRGAW